MIFCVGNVEIRFKGLPTIWHNPIMIAEDMQNAWHQLQAKYERYRDQDVQVKGMREVKDFESLIRLQMDPTYNSELFDVCITSVFEEAQSLTMEERLTSDNQAIRTIGKLLLDDE